MLRRGGRRHRLLVAGRAAGALLVPGLVHLGGSRLALLGVAAVLPLAGSAGGRAVRLGLRDTLDREPFLTAVLGHAPTQRQADASPTPGSQSASDYPTATLPDDRPLDKGLVMSSFAAGCSAADCPAAGIATAWSAW